MPLISSPCVYIHRPQQLKDQSWLCSCDPKAGCDEHEQVPSLDADLFDVVAGRSGKRGAWYSGGAPGLEKVAASIAVPTAAKQQGRVRERHWSCDSDVFAVPEISQQPPAKKARLPATSSFWCF
jgi:hypothetical protein